jgi:hypothetical protein
MYGNSVNRQAGVALVLVATLSGLLAAAVSGGQVWSGRAVAEDEALVRQEPLPMLPEVVVTATRLKT